MSKSGCCQSPSPPPPNTTWWAPGKSPSPVEPGDQAALGMLSHLCAGRTLAASSVGGGSDSDGEGSIPLTPFFLFSRLWHIHSMAVCGRWPRGGIPLSFSVSPEKCCTFITGWLGMVSWGGCREQGRPLSNRSVASQGLVSSRHRLIMCQLAVQNSDWIR